jgi:phosphoribosyl 1,2-cyclic phosphate phosphodiesterase
MPMTKTFTFLGSGGSMGVPVMGCSCEVCRSSDWHNKRLRSAGLFHIEGKQILIDCGPDFRQQALKAEINHLDGIIFTHAHYDHIGGIDDLRGLFMSGNSPVPCFLSEETAQDIRRRFDYIFVPNESKLVPRIQLMIHNKVRGNFELNNISFTFMTYEQAGMKVNGIRYQDFAYVSDIHRYDETIFEDLKNVKTLVLSALRFTPSQFHFSIDEAVDFSRKVGAQRTFLTHIAHELDYEKTNAYLPTNIRLAYDGLQIEL